MITRFWVVSPNAQNDGNIDYWLTRSKEESKVFVGYDKDKKHGETFEKALSINDIILIAQGAKDNRKLFLGGIITSTRNIDEKDGMFYRDVNYLISEKDFVNNQIEINSNNAFGESNNPGAIYELKVSNDYDNQVIQKINLLFHSILSKKAMEANINALKYKKQIILQGPPGTGKTRHAKELAYELIFNQTLSTENIERKKQLNELEECKEFNIIQFHPAYSYEDFVRGITAKTNGNQIEYKTVDKVLGEFAKQAYNSNFEYYKSASNDEFINWLNKVFELYLLKINEDISKNGKYIINEIGSYIESIQNNNFECSFKNKNITNNNNPNELIISFEEFKDLITVNKDYTKLGSIGFNNHTSLMYHTLKEPLVLNFINTFSKNFVLIIDEINRANLPAVLGELIYALEYRGETVNSMYDIEGKTEIVLPPNLYIIGTMNTADRSVGHIDYAIRRRFAFVDVLPDADVISNTKAKEIFIKLHELFKTNTSSDFEPQDVCLGHSYFIVKDDQELKQKLKYEVLPIFKEYIKDGVLNKNKDTTDFIDYINTLIKSLGA